MLAVALLVVLGRSPERPEPWRAAAEVVERGVARRLFPGAVLVVGRRDSILLARGFGRTSWERSAPVPDPGSTVWDLASLTKVVATTSAAMALVDAGRLDLELPVARYLPRFAGEGRSAVTVRMLLDHTSGLPAFAPLYRRAGGRDDMLGGVFEVPLRSAPGSRHLYSDLNAILLGLVVEAVSGESLDRFADRAVFSPLGMRHTAFAVADRTRVAPSLVLQGRLMVGVPNDPNARALGVVGHAGLFASGLDLARYAQAWLELASGRPTSPGWLDTATARRFLWPPGHRSLGWEQPSLERLERSAYGLRATPTMFGHTGWTGTFLWFDPARDLFMVLLTNRSLGPNNRASFAAMRRLRARLSDAIAEAVPAVCGGDGCRVATGPADR